MQKMIRMLPIIRISPLLIAFFLAFSGCADSAKPAPVILENVRFPEGFCFVQETVQISASLRNTTKTEKTVWTEWALLDRNGIVIDYHLREDTLPPDQETHLTVSYEMPAASGSAKYRTGLTVWDQDPASDGAAVIAGSQSENPLFCYTKQEEFDLPVTNLWEVSDKTLGRTNLRKENVVLSDSMLSIQIPENSLDGGEIYNREMKSYGVYEARMKLPDAPSSLTGFFLYSPPDFYHEIDIELLNQPEGILMLTTYAEGEKRKTVTHALDFDPTADFHDYRIEYNEESIGFYVDNKYIAGWSDHCPSGEMQLMVNVWFPTWLEGIPPEEDQRLLVDWIRY